MNTYGGAMMTMTGLSSRVSLRIVDRPTPAL
ncbi:MAG: hypothetical protein AVDCRST_MAG60-2474 [uncultured Nocardioides sp.]|uniref:Uncharacterized protein n=1 Tax=uncultured Nocardioides sp. TaxID=198441 RepID=A0A6J4P760_9ACTN|nr:MAG: hypothetical protein AVDCRST_MAG60-2474 [uncultured Nocardioides sp.]